ncbi:MULTISPECIES: transposase [unclassified Streptomyces]|uniref:transposase n=1 Tax=unclassified Streptomyces TaxID=2593676 RepID=UPI00386B3E1F|nr:transposase [Streptomyces sp. NBC_01017]WSV35943.1 transposase [Streptomyces sp. NBC_01017]
MLYLVNNGIKWAEMPVDLPPWKAVYRFFRRWQHPSRSSVSRRALSFCSTVAVSGDGSAWSTAATNSVTVSVTRCLFHDHQLHR